LQGKIIDYIKGKGEVTIEEMMENLNLTEEVLRREFAVLRHMEILGRVKRGEKVLFTLFKVSHV
jgi:DeoR/GlpR family transcriptional regulator of sugar metabolism